MNGARFPAERETAQVTLQLWILALGLYFAGAMAFTRQRRMVTVACCGLFAVVACFLTVAVWWPVSPTWAVVLLVATMGLPALTLALFAVDFVFAPFGAEMTYPGMLFWVLWLVLLAADLLGLPWSL